MRKKTTTLFLAAAACCSLMALAVVRQFDRKETVAQGRANRLFPTSLAYANLLVIDRGDWSQELEPFNSGWKITRPYSAIADATEVQRLLDALEAAPRFETISLRDQEKRGLETESFGLDLPRARIVVGVGTTRYELLVGADAPVSNQVFVCHANDKSVHVTSSSIIECLPSDTETLRDRALVHSDPKRIDGIDIRRPGRSFVRLQRKDKYWMITQPFAAAADGAFVNCLLSTICSTRIEKFRSDYSGAAGASLATALGDGAAGDPDNAVTRIVLRTSGAGAHDEEVALLASGSTLPGHVLAIAPDGGTRVEITNSLARIALTPLAAIRDPNIVPQSIGEVSAIGIQREGQSLALRRSQSGEWEITIPVHGPADQATAARMLDGILRLRATKIYDPLHDAAPAVASTGDAVSDAPDIASGGTNNFENVCTVELAATGASPVLKIFRYPDLNGWIGIAPTNSSALYMLPQTNLPSILFAPIDLAMLHSRTIFDIDPKKVRRVTLDADDDSQVVVARDPIDAWIPEKGSNAPDAAGFEEYLGKLAKLKAARVLSIEPRLPSPEDPEQQKPWLKITLDLEADTSVRRILAVFGPTDDGGREANVLGSDALFELSPESVELLGRLRNAAGLPRGAPQRE